MNSDRNIYRSIQVIGFMLGFVLSSAASGSCELGPFHCDGSVPGQGPLCYCDADGLLCGHDGFPSCSECQQP